MLGWLVRWMIWLFLIAKEAKEWGSYFSETMVISRSFFFAFGSTALLTICACLWCTIFPVWFSAEVFVRLGCGAFVAYLLLGLLLFFSESDTNAPIPWHKKGAW